MRAAELGRVALGHVVLLLPPPAVLDAGRDVGARLALEQVREEHLQVTSLQVYKFKSLQVYKLQSYKLQVTSYRCGRSTCKATRCKATSTRFCGRLLRVTHAPRTAEGSD